MTKPLGGTELMANRIGSDCNQSLLPHFQIIHSRVRDLDPDKKKILVLHDLPGDPEAQHLKDGGWEKFDQLVFVSHWQQQMFNLYLGVPIEKGIVLRNAIEKIETHAKPTDKIRLIYTSTPHRGLNILVPVFERLAKEFDNVELDVFSSFDLYGWPQRNVPYQQLFDRIEAHPNMNYHGAKSNKQVREALKQAHIFAYPSTWQETSCLCLIEAMSAGLMCIHSSLAALPETSMALTSMYGYKEDLVDHAELFYAELRNAILLYQNPNTRSQVQVYLNNVKQMSDFVYSWDARRSQWDQLMKSMM